MMTLETSPCQSTALPPAAAIVEPITPPISACDELDGMPNSQVTRFQMMPPARPAATTVSVTSPVSTRPLAMVAATARERNAPTKFSSPEIATAVRGRQRPRRDGRRHRVPRVVEAVGEVKGQGRDDHQDEYRVVTHNCDRKSLLVGSEGSESVQLPNIR